MDRQIPAGVESKKIDIAARPIDGVSTFDITSEFRSQHGLSLADTGLLFMRAHMTLKIKLRSDKTTGLGWVTPSEAEQIRAHMAANV